MSLVLSPATEARIQAELATGRCAAPDELLNHALDLLKAEEGQEDWLFANKDAVRAMLDESLAAEARRESYSTDEAEAILAKRRAASPHRPS